MGLERKNLLAPAIKLANRGPYLASLNADPQAGTVVEIRTDGY
jgi:hypothetical protein